MLYFQIATEEWGKSKQLFLGEQEFAQRHKHTSSIISSILATAVGLAFAGGLNRSLKALDEDSGEVFWETMLDGAPSSIIVTYAVDDIQYLALGLGQMGQHTNGWNRIYGRFAEAEGMSLNYSPPGWRADFSFSIAVARFYRAHWSGI